MYRRDSSLQCAELSAATRFALMLETACRDFDTLRRMARQELKVVTADGSKNLMALTASAAIRMALAKSFVAHVVRARRICEHDAAELRLDRTERRLFLSGTAAVVKVRDVNEHGFDGIGSVRPSMHWQEGARLDETSLVIDGGSEKILMGPLNLNDIYNRVERLQRLAGFSSLAGFG